MNWLQKLFSAWGINVGELLHRYAQMSLGKDMSPVYDELGCAEALNNIAQRALGSPIGGGASTYRMYQVLRTSPRFTRVRDPRPGDIIISPTGYGDRTKVSNGHVGVVSDGGVIMSNNSYNSLWEENYTIKSWRDKYVKQGNYPVYYYRVRY